MNVDIDKFVASYPDFPEAGILFRDISPLLKSPEAMSWSKTNLATAIEHWSPDYIAGIDARGFLFSALVADVLNIGSIMVRKIGKLPGQLESRKYSLEYGIDGLSIKQDADLKDARVVLMDDLLATGGTLSCAKELIESQGAQVVGCAVVVELLNLKGKATLTCPIFSLTQYDD